MGLRSTILLNATIVFGTAAILVGLTVWALITTRSSASVLSEQLAPQMLASNKLMLLMWETRLHSQNYSLSGDQHFHEKNTRQLGAFTDGNTGNAKTCPAKYRPATEERP